MNNEKSMLEFLEALADNVDSLSDDEVLAEAYEEGDSPGDIANQTRFRLQSAVKKFKQRALIAAKEQHQQRTAQFAAMRVHLPTSPAERRQLLGAVIEQHQQAGRMLIAQHRDFKELTDEDVESWLQQFVALGLVDGKLESGE